MVTPKRIEEQTWPSAIPDDVAREMSRLGHTVSVLAQALGDACAEIERLDEHLQELGHPRQDKTCAVLDDAEEALRDAGLMDEPQVSASKTPTESPEIPAIPGSKG